jgi:hypothetical protein
MGLPRAAFALALSIAICSCVQEVKITAPRYALVYGVSTYQSMYLEADQYSPYTSTTVPANFDNLSYSDDDAKSLGDLMTNQGWTVQERIKGNIISSDPTKDATLEKPTRQQMQTDINTLALSIQADSTVLIYFSGHGTYVNGTAYLVPYDGISDDPSPTLHLSNCIAPADLNSMLAVLPTKNIIVILDTCYSGSFVSPGSAIDASPQDYSSMPYFSAFATALSNFGSLLVANAAASGAKTPIVLSAAGTNESSYDGTMAMQHGVFTYYLLQAATNGDSNGDGVVTTTEAYVYTSAAIKSQWDANPYVTAFLPHISGGTRDLVLFVK